MRIRVESSHVNFVSMYVKTELEAQFLVMVVLARIAWIAPPRGVRSKFFASFSNLYQPYTNCTKKCLEADATFIAIVIVVVAVFNAPDTLLPFLQRQINQQSSCKHKRVFDREDSITNK